jgi:hypothetical protein
VSRAPVIVALLVLAGVARADDPPVRDPMRPFASVSSAAGVSAIALPGTPRFALTGVLISPSRRVAILNGKPYTAGAIVDGAELVAIEPGVVHLREHGAQLVISLALRAKPQPKLVGEPIP